MRYYLAPLTGDGTDESPYRPALPENIAGYAALIPSNRDGTPRIGWVLCLVDGDHVALGQDSTLIQLLELDTRMSTVRNNQRNQYENRIRQNGYDITVDWQNDTAADVVDRLALVAEPTWKRGGMSLGGR